MTQKPPSLRAPPLRRPPPRPLALAALLAVLASGCLGRALQAGRYRAAITVPVASPPGYAYLRLAEEQGLAERRQLALVPVAVRDPQAIVAGYQAGRFAIAPLTTVEVLQICHSRPQRCPRLLLILDESWGADQVVVRPEVVDLEGLRGRRVAVVPSSLGPFLLGRALATVGMALSDVQLLPTPPDTMPRLLHRGEVDGAALSVPYSAHATRLGTSRAVFDSNRIPGEITLVLAADPALLERQPEAVARLLRVWQDVHEWERHHPGEAAERLGDQQGLSATAVRRSQEGLRWFPLQEQRQLLRPGGALALQLIQVRSLLQGLALLPPQTPMPAIDRQPLERALALP